MIEDYQAKRRRTRRVSRLLLVAGIVLAALAAGATYLYAGRALSVPAPVQPTATVIVATRDVPARTTLATGDLRTVRTAPELVPPGALTSPEAAAGRVTTVPIAAGEMILPSKFQSVEGIAPFSIFPAGQTPTGGAPEFRAMSISVPDAQAVGGAVQPGDIVDIVFTLTFDASKLIPGTADKGTDLAAKITFEKVLILARALSTYTIRVEAAQAERIAVLTTASQINLLLRARDDTRSVRATGALFSTETASIVRAIR